MSNKRRRKRNNCRRRKPREIKQFNKNGIPMESDRPPRRRYLPGDKVKED